MCRVRRRERAGGRSISGSVQPSCRAQRDRAAAYTATAGAGVAGCLDGIAPEEGAAEVSGEGAPQLDSGNLVLHALIGKEGDIVDLTVVSGDPLLAKSALKAVKQWKYKPYLFQGNPVEVDTEILVNFALSEN